MEKDVGTIEDGNGRRWYNERWNKEDVGTIEEGNRKTLKSDLAWEILHLILPFGSDACEIPE